MSYSESEVVQFIKENDVRFIKLFFTDIFGSIKSISIQPSELERAFETGISFDASAVKGFLDICKSDLFIVPDPSTLCVLPWRPQHGRVVRFYCNIRYADGTPFEGDTRLLLQKKVKEIYKKGYEVRVGTECEFYLFRNDDKGMPTKIPHDFAGYCDLAPMDKGENVRREICLTLEQMQVHPESSHHENGPGQNEVDFKYSDPLNAADNLGTFKTVVKTIANQNGLFASFLPKPFADKAGSGLHINISVFNAENKNLFADNLTAEARSFIAGVMAHIKEITVFTNPLKQSYERLGKCEAPKYISWSCENRSQLIRIPAVGSHSQSRMELRSPDPACNHYLAIYLILCAGFEGIEKQLELCDSINKNMLSLSDDEVSGIDKLPSSLSEAVKCAKNSEFIKSVLPEVLLKVFDEIESIAEPEFGEF